MFVRIRMLYICSSEVGLDDLATLYAFEDTLQKKIVYI